jgi:hypothetical protein
LYLQPVVTKQGLTVATLVDLICVYVETTMGEDVAEAEIVTSHCRVMTPVECRGVGTAKPDGDKPFSFIVIEQDSLEALSHEWLPAVKTLADVWGYSARIVPELYDNLWYVGWARRCVYRSSFLDELPHVTGSEMFVFRNAGWIIEKLHLLNHEGMGGVDLAIPMMERC